MAPRDGGVACTRSALVAMVRAASQGTD
jgi:hypothetical protein